MKQHRAIAVLLLVALLAQACGGNFASQLRSILSKSEPLVDALVTAGAIRPELRDTTIRDFTDMAKGAATLGDDLKACADNACKLESVDRFGIIFWDVLRRGRFSKVEKLQRIQAIVSGIILAARVAFGAAAPKGERVVPVEEGIARLKAEMRT